jgi:Flp pilus assembly protein TadD
MSRSDDTFSNEAIDAFFKFTSRLRDWTDSIESGATDRAGRSSEAARDALRVLLAMLPNGPAPASNSGLNPSDQFYRVLTTLEHFARRL